MQYPPEAPIPEATVTIHPGDDTIQLQFNKTFTLVAGDTVNLMMKGFIIIPEDHYNALCEYYNWSEAVTNPPSDGEIYTLGYQQEERRAVVPYPVPEQPSIIEQAIARVMDSIRTLTSRS